MPCTSICDGDILSCTLASRWVWPIVYACIEVLQWRHAHVVTVAKAPFWVAKKRVARTVRIGHVCTWSWGACVNLVHSVCEHQEDGRVKPYGLCSKYYQGLNIEAKKWYDVRLGILGSLGDPYSSLKNLPVSLKWQHWPSIEYPDISNYLITTPSLYTIKG